MEKPTYTAIDYNSKENKVIEGLVRDNYSKIKNTFYKVFYNKLPGILGLWLICVWLWCLGMPLSRKPKISWY